MKKFGLSVIALVLSLAFANFASAAENAMVRIFHASPDAPAVDVYVNGDAVVEGAEFKDATDYLELPAGKHMVEIYPAGDMSNAVISTELEVMAGQAYTVAAINDLTNLELSVTTDTMMVEEGKRKYVLVTFLLMHQQLMSV
ncbi:DUF4397 domain-containing protein [Bacillus coahuilensis]|uniref:DUF4397 domain-containing protein n=1 Tax=Bacillus coahuilensis TaxID=408580 RepID=UPI00018511D1|nr:DUF4397 domain-containing protein [Bacillus coahuilensis]